MSVKLIKMNKHNYISLSHWIDESSPTYSNQGGFKRESISSIKKGRTSNSESWSFNNHIGTHIDFPRHFFNEGKSSSDYSLPFFIFNNIGIIFLDKTPKSNQIIDYELIKNECNQIEKNIEVLILKTGFEKYREEKIYWSDNPSFHKDVGVKLKEKFKKLQIFGFDTISLTSVNNKGMGKLAHLEFLQKDSSILIIEDMKLSLIDKLHLPEEIIISPLMIKNSDGSPVNCVLKVK